MLMVANWTFLTSRLGAAVTTPHGQGLRHHGAPAVTWRSEKAGWAALDDIRR